MLMYNDMKPYIENHHMPPKQPHPKTLIKQDWLLKMTDLVHD